MAIFTRRALLGGMAVAGLTLSVRRAQAGYEQDQLSQLTTDQRASHDALRARMIAALPFERVTVPGDRAEAEWQRLKSAGRGWPVVIGDDEQLDRIAEQFSMNDPAVFPEQTFGSPLRSPAEIIETARGLRFPADLSRWLSRAGDEEPVAAEGRWPDAPLSNEGSGGITIAFDILSGRPLERVHILLIPTDSSWEVPAYLRWGDWNACPPPEYHVAALHSWHNRFGAELAGIGFDTMNLRATRRPVSRPDALSLAREQYRYCPDIVDQGVDTLAALASILMADDWWYFWWD